MRKKGFSTIIFYLLIAVGLYFIMNGVLGGGFGNRAVERVNYSQLVEYINQSQVSEITISYGKNSMAYVEARLNSTQSIVTAYAPSEEIAQIINDYQTANPGLMQIEYGMLSEESWSSIIMTVMSFAVVGFILFFFLSQQGSGGGKVMSFGKSKAKMYTKGDDPPGAGKRHVGQHFRRHLRIRRLLQFL